MKRWLVVFCLAVNFLPAQTVVPHVVGRLLIQQRKDADGTAVATALTNANATVANTMTAIDVKILSLPEPQGYRGTDTEPGIIRRRDALIATGLFTFVEQDFLARSGQSTLVPNDTDYASQWHLPKIQAPEAWFITQGSAQVPIAIIDSGVDSTHPDLTAKVQAGYSFLTGTTNTSDVYGHGTSVAGTAAAVTNNATGTAGVGWLNPIVPLVVLDANDFASYSNIASAIIWAADHGIRIANVSIGGSSPSSTLQNAIDYAWSRGTVVFASAMNNATSTPYYPAACDHVISVSATNESDALTSFSNFGATIDLSAPGINILSPKNGGGYWYTWGTSFSSPIVAATAALVLSRQPSLTNDALVSILENNADDKGATGWDQYFGFGRINAYRAVNAASASDTTAPSVTISTPANSATVSGTVSITGTATDNVAVTSIEWYLDGQLQGSTTTSPFSFSWVTSTNGSHTIQVKAYDAASNVGSSSVTVTVNNSVPADTTPPTVSITSPINGATVTGNITITAGASDNVAVSQVSIYVDNVLRCTDSTSPYSCTWNTKKYKSGTSHTIKATAWDTTGNFANSAIITVTRQ